MVRKQSVPGIFCRPLTPRSKSHLKKTYFYSTSGDSKFKDVREKGFCLRCYGNNHRASACKTYTSPTPTPCRNCMHLFHPTEKCKFYNAEGKSRPSSRPRSSSREKWLVKDIPNSDFQLSQDSHVISELWEGEFDFHYFSDFELYSNDSVMPR